MAPHLTKKELDLVRVLGGRDKTPAEIHARIVTSRGQKQLEPPEIGAVRRALKGMTFRVGLKETRGRKKTLSKANLRTINKVPRLVR